MINFGYWYLTKIFTQQHAIGRDFIETGKQRISWGSLHGHMAIFGLDSRLCSVIIVNKMSFEKFMELK